MKEKIQDGLMSPLTLSIASVINGAASVIHFHEGESEAGACFGLYSLFAAYLANYRFNEKKAKD